MVNGRVSSSMRRRSSGTCSGAYLVPEWSTKDSTVSGIAIAPGELLHLMSRYNSLVYAAASRRRCNKASSVRSRLDVVVNCRGLGKKKNKVSYGGSLNLPGAQPRLS